MDIEKRDEKIYKLRQSGTVYREIGEKYGISKERVRQIYIRVKYVKDNYNKWPPLKQMLPLHLQVRLVKYFGTEEIINSPEMLANIGRTKLLKYRCIGLKTVREIAHALCKLGYIKDEYIWMEET